jgi:hypothetical protein
MAKSLRVTRWYSHLVTTSRGTARKYSYEHNLTPEFVLSLFEKQNGRCYWLGIPLVPSVECRNIQRPSLDRLDPSRGYTQDNVVLACQFANMGRCSATAEGFANFLEAHRLNHNLARPEEAAGPERYYNGY